MIILRQNLWRANSHYLQTIDIILVCIPCESKNLGVWGNKEIFAAHRFFSDWNLIPTSDGIPIYNTQCQGHNRVSWHSPWGFAAGIRRSEIEALRRRKCLEGSRSPVCDTKRLWAVNICAIYFDTGEYTILLIIPKTDKWNDSSFGVFGTSQSERLSLTHTSSQRPNTVWKICKTHSLKITIFKSAISLVLTISKYNPCFGGKSVSKKLVLIVCKKTGAANCAKKSQRTRDSEQIQSCKKEFLNFHWHYQSVEVWLQSRIRLYFDC